MNEEQRGYDKTTDWQAEAERLRALLDLVLTVLSQPELPKPERDRLRATLLLYRGG